MSGPRPATVVIVAGTGTEVGKTWVSARLLEAWRASGRTTAARKPVQSYQPGSGPTDAAVLAGASGEDPGAVCRESRSYPVAMAPPMAADVLGRARLSVADLAAELDWPEPRVDVGLVETVGGVRSPHAHDGDGVALARAVRPDRIVLVADAGLGTINAVRLCADALGPLTRPDGSRCAPVVVLNRFDPASDLHGRNRAWLSERDGIDVVPATDEGLRVLADRLSPLPAPLGPAHS